jgi:hypothetical protein
MKLSSLEASSNYKLRERESALRGSVRTNGTSAGRRAHGSVWAIIPLCLEEYIIGLEWKPRLVSARDVH